MAYLDSGPTLQGPEGAYGALWALRALRWLRHPHQLLLPDVAQLFRFLRFAPHPAGRPGNPEKRQLTDTPFIREGTSWLRQLAPAGGAGQSPAIKASLRSALTYLRPFIKSGYGICLTVRMKSVEGCKMLGGLASLCSDSVWEMS